MDKEVNTHAKSVFSMTNLTFSSVSSVIFTVGWLAYGIIEVKSLKHTLLSRTLQNTAASTAGNIY